MNNSAIKFIKKEIAKRFDIGVSRISFNGHTLIKDMKTNAELRALVRTHTQWLAKALRDQSKRSVGQLVTIYPKKYRMYKIYNKSMLVSIPKESRPRKYKLKKPIVNKRTIRAYKLKKLRLLRSVLTASRKSLTGHTYRKLRQLVKSKVIDSIAKLNSTIANVSVHNPPL